ncbi:MAG TPA: helix-turn-helix transcriptional regulator [Polyangiales bacterium]
MNPRPALAAYVRHVRLTYPQHEPQAYVRLPDGEVELVVQLSEDSVAAHAIGTRLAPLRKTGHTPREALAVRFKAGGAYPFFGLPVSELTDRVLSMETLWGAESRQLTEALRGAHSSDARVAAIEQALSARLQGAALYEPSSAGAARRAIRLVQQSRVLPNVEELADQLGASARQLRRAFAAVVGLSPKEYLRVLRFQRALQTARRQPHLPWGVIANQAGFYDQAHLVAEFQALGGASPGALLPGTRRQTAHRTDLAPAI